MRPLPDALFSMEFSLSSLCLLATSSVNATFDVAGNFKRRRINPASLVSVGERRNQLGTGDPFGSLVHEVSDPETHERSLLSIGVCWRRLNRVTVYLGSNASGISTPILTPHVERHWV